MPSVLYSELSGIWSDIRSGKDYQDYLRYGSCCEIGDCINRIDVLDYNSVSSLTGDQLDEFLMKEKYLDSRLKFLGIVREQLRLELQCLDDNSHYNILENGSRKGYNLLLLRRSFNDPRVTFTGTEPDLYIREFARNLSRNEAIVFQKRNKIKNNFNLVLSSYFEGLSYFDFKYQLKKNWESLKTGSYLFQYLALNESILDDYADKMSEYFWPIRFRHLENVPDEVDFYCLSGPKRTLRLFVPAFINNQK